MGRTMSEAQRKQLSKIMKEKHRQKKAKGIPWKAASMAAKARLGSGNVMPVVTPDRLEAIVLVNDVGRILKVILKNGDNSLEDLTFRVLGV